MIRKITSLIMLLMCLQNAAVFSAEWTVMFYEDGDNILERDAIDNFNTMAEVGSDENINLVMLIDLFDGAENPFGNWTDARRGIINRGDIPSSDWGEDIGEVNMGDGRTLEDFINWAITNYPANKYALVLLSHGGEWRICTDDTSRGDALYTKELGQALQNIPTHIDLIGFDACLTSMVEVAYEIRNEGSVMVASQGLRSILRIEGGIATPLAWSSSWPFEIILPELFAHPAMDATELGTLIVEKFGEYWKEGHWIILSALDLAQLSVLADALDAFAEAVIHEAHAWHAVYEAMMGTPYVYSLYYWMMTFRDLGAFIDSVAYFSEHEAVVQAAENVRTAFANTIIANHCPLSYGRQKYNGLGIYLSSYGAQVDPEYNATNLDFAKDTHWDEFLRAFSYADISFDLSEYDLIYRTGFDDGLPEGWSIDDGLEDAHTWRTDNPRELTSPVWEDTVMIIDKSYEGEAGFEEQLISCTIDCSEYQTVLVSFGHLIGVSGDTTANIDVRIGSGPWQNVRTYQYFFSGHGTVYKDISGIAAGETLVQIRWYFKSSVEEGEGWGWGIDNVEVWGIPDPPLGLNLPTPVNEDEGILGGTVFIDEPLEFDLFVSLSSDNEWLLDVPDSVIIEAGDTEQDFSVAVFDNSDIDQSPSVFVSARAEGFFHTREKVVINQEDTDGDRLGDDWEEHFFGHLEESTYGDFDRDGYHNFKEYSYRTDPTDPLSNPGNDFNSTNGGCLTNEADHSSGASLWFVISVIGVLYAFAKRDCRVLRARHDMFD